MNKKTAVYHETSENHKFPGPRTQAHLEQGQEEDKKKDDEKDQHDKASTEKHERQDELSIDKATEDRKPPD